MFTAKYVCADLIMPLLYCELFFLGGVFFLSFFSLSLRGSWRGPCCGEAVAAREPSCSLNCASVSCSMLLGLFLFPA